MPTATQPASYAIVEPLESRQLLATAVHPGDYFAPVGAQLTYSTWEDGVKLPLADAEKMTLRSVKISGVRMIVERTDQADGACHLTYYSRAADGNTLLHMMKDYEEGSVNTITLTPPLVAMSSTLNIGQTHKASTNAVFTDTRGAALWGRIKLSYTVVGSERVKVPAGRFATIKTNMSMTVTMSYDSLYVTVSTVTSNWRAKGLGTVKESNTSVIKYYQNGRLDRQETQTTAKVLLAYTLPAKSAPLPAPPVSTKPAPARVSLFSSNPLPQDLLTASDDTDYPILQ